MMAAKFFQTSGILLAAAVLLSAAPGFALDKPEKQVMIESRVAEVSEEALKDLGVEYTIFQPIEGRDAKGEYAFVISPTVDFKYKIEVTGLVYGRGADFRRWVPQNPQIILEKGDYGDEYFDDYYDYEDEEGPLKVLLPASLRLKYAVVEDKSDRIILRPELTTKLYIDKPSIASPVAPILFAAIGTQYTQSGEKAAASPGTACSSSGGSHGSSGSRGGVSEAIDRAGMAAGMGLLTSQAKGQIEGQKVVFLSDIPVAKFLFRTEAYNKDKKQLIILTTPVIIRDTGDIE